jgi:parvulin-like peptidyl-prolyl isomerase
MKRCTPWINLCCLPFLLLPLLAHGQELPPDVLLRNRWMNLTRADYESALHKLPPRLRGEFESSPRRVQDLLNSLLVTKTLAAQARVHGAKPAAPAGTGPGDDADRALAAAELQRIDADAGKVFDARKAEYEKRAHEIYAVDRNKFEIPEAVRLSDIAIAIKGRGEDAALARAREARERVVAGGDFAAVAREYSDDAKTRDKGGMLPFMPRRELADLHVDPAFMLKPGEISQPIKTAAAYHVMRLDERRPAKPLSFDEAHDSIMQGLRKQFVAEERQQRIEAIYRDPELQVNQAQVDALVAPSGTAGSDGASASSPPPTPSAPAGAPK